MSSLNCLDSLRQVVVNYVTIWCKQLRIEIKGMAQDFYRTLGISKDASQDAIRKAYRKLARKWHPDVNPGSKDAEQKFKEISRAYECLGNEEKKKLYDEFGEEGLHPGFDSEKMRQYRAWQSATGTSGAGEESDWSGRYQSYEDIFGDLFGAGRGERSFRSSGPAGGRDVKYEMTVDFIAALRGIETEISMQKIMQCDRCNGSGTEPGTKLKPCSGCGGSGRLNVAEGPIAFTQVCPQCGGHGRVGDFCSMCRGSGQVVGTEKIRVKIPPGVRDGAKVRVAGKGEAGQNGGKPGDLYLIVNVTPHPVLSRKGDDLHMEVPVTIHEIMAGGMITIPTVEGDVKVSVPPKSQSGQNLRLKGKGAYNPKKRKRGDILMKLVVKVPQTDDVETIEAARKMETLYREDIRKTVKL